MSPKLDLSVGVFNAEDRNAWDTFVRASKNGTFLHERAYMEYHASRFTDYSLIVRAGSEIVAVLPANKCERLLHSHQGLTYGGLLVDEKMTTPTALLVFAAVGSFLSQNGIDSLEYKTIPSIYHHVPAEEDRYALFLADAVLYRRDVLSVIPRAGRGRVQDRRLRGARKAERTGVVVARSEDWEGYWSLLNSHLETRFGVKPTHTLEEITLLRSCFPQSISLFTARLDGALAAGVVIYETANVAHVQYIAANEVGRLAGALDLLFFTLIDGVYADKCYFDFGISSERNGRLLNEGLIEQKEGFGARAVVHDYYRVQSDKLKCLG